MNRKVGIVVGVVLMLAAWGAYYQAFGCVGLDCIRLNVVFVKEWEIFFWMFAWFAADGLMIVFGVWFIIEFGRAFIRWTSTGSGRSNGKTPSLPS